MSDIHKSLAKEFPPNKVQDKKGRGGKTFRYISHALVTERLNQSDPNWSSSSVSEHIYHDDLGRPHCVGVTIALTIHDTLGNSATRVETGGPQNITGTTQFPYNFADEIKNAYSDALKRAAMRFGVALSMWEDLIDAEGDEDVYPETVNTQTSTTHNRVEVAQRVFDAEPVEQEKKPWAQGGNTGERTPGGATIKQLNYALVLCKEAGMSEPERHQMLQTKYKVKSLNDLNSIQMREFIDHVKPLAVGGEQAPAPDSEHGDVIVSWTEFYKLARPHGISNREAFEEIVGIEMPTTLDDAVYALQSYLDAQGGSA